MVDTVYRYSIGKSKLLVASDLHVGDPRQHPGVLDAFHGVVKSECPDCLVLAGDVLEGNIASSSQIEQLRNVCLHVGNVVILKGNHDRSDTSELASSIGCGVGYELIGRSGVANFAVEHGDQFDATWNYTPWLGWVGIWINRAIYRIFRFDTQAWTRTWKCVHHKLLQQHENAWKHWSKKAIVITGHTHIPTGDPTGVGYFNSGDWLVHRSYCIIHNGVAELKHVNSRT